FQAAQAAKRRAWGGNPNKIPIGQNERLAKFGTVVESCSKKVTDSAVLAFAVFPRLAWRGFCQFCGGIFPYSKAGNKQNGRKKTGNLFP
ncbi:MAG: hypothetical protein K1W41_12340, partial [Lachnospiraceae bacterium]